MEHAKMKRITHVIVRLWMTIGTMLILFFIVAPVDLLKNISCEIIACYGILEFFITSLERKYWPERSTSKTSKIIGVIMILFILIKGVFLIAS